MRPTKTGVDLRGDWGLQKTYEDWRGPAEIGGFIRPGRTGADRRGDDSGGASLDLGRLAWAMWRTR